MQVNELLLQYFQEAFNRKSQEDLEFAAESEEEIWITVRKK